MINRMDALLLPVWIRTFANRNVLLQCAYVYV